MSKPYYSFRPWINWLLPLPALIWLSKRRFLYNHTWYQDDVYQVVFSRRKPPTLDRDAIKVAEDFWLKFNPANPTGLVEALAALIFRERAGAVEAFKLWKKGRVR